MWKVKSCGKAHAYCEKCKPGTTAKISTAQRGVPASQRGRACQLGCSCLRHQKIDRPWCCKPKPNRKTPKPFSIEHRRKLSEARRREWARGERHGQAGQPTGIQQKLLIFLRKAGFEGLRMEEPFGRYRVDIYIPSHHLAFEADGEVWHENHPFRDQVTRDRKRDQYLLEEHNLPVARLTGTEIENLGTTIG